MRSIAFAKLVFLAVVLSACALQKLETGMAGLVGKSESQLFSTLGYPDNKQEFGSSTVYTWSNSNTSTYVIPQTNTTTAYVGTTPIYGTTTTYVPQTIHGHCEVKVSVVGGYVESWETYGNDTGCARYASRFE